MNTFQQEQHRDEEIFGRKRFAVPLLGKLSIFLTTLFLFLIVYATYHPALLAQFVWDDAFLVTGNPMIKSPVLGLEVFRHFLFEDARNDFYRPVQSLSYIFDYWRGGLDPAVYHQTNLAIHALNSILIFFLGRQILTRLGCFSERRSFWSAVFLAVSWALHPVHSAITAYVSGRADSLALLGFLGGWLCWEQGLVARWHVRKWLFGAAALLTCLACCSKEIALATLGLFGLHIWLFRGELPNRFRTKTSVGLIIILLGYLILRQIPDANIRPGSSPAIPTMEKLHLFLRAMGDYARLFVFPKQLFMERQVSLDTGLFTNPVKNDPLFPYLGRLGIVFLSIVLSSLFWRRNSQKLRWFGALWFAVTILPVSNLFTLNATVAEHWLYIPSIGLIFWVLACWNDFPRRLQTLAMWIAPLLVLGLGMRANTRAKDWKDPLTFYHATIRDGGDSIRVRVNLAGEYRKLGHLIEAEKIYRSVLQVRPDYQPAKQFLAQLLSTQGRNDESALMPAEKVLNEGSQLAATKAAREAYENRPHSWATAKSLITIYQNQNQPKVALAVVKQFAGKAWWHAESHKLLGSLAAELHLDDEAVVAYLAAARLDIRDAESINHAAAIVGDMGNFPEAIRLQKKAVARDGGKRQQDLLETLNKLASEARTSP